MPKKMQLYTVYLFVNCSTCFGRFPHSSSGAQITVSTASGTGQPLLLPVATANLTEREKILILASEIGHERKPRYWL